MALHGGIAVVMGLWSFSLAMFAGLILYLRPWERPLSPPRPLRGWLERVELRPLADHFRSRLVLIHRRRPEPDRRRIGPLTTCGGWPSGDDGAGCRRP